MYVGSDHCLGSKFEFQYFFFIYLFFFFWGGGGVQKKEYFWGYEDFVNIFFGSSQNLTVFRGNFYAF